MCHLIPREMNRTHLVLVCRAWLNQHAQQWTTESARTTELACCATDLPEPLCNWPGAGQCKPIASSSHVHRSILGCSVEPLGTPYIFRVVKERHDIDGRASNLHIFYDIPNAGEAAHAGPTLSASQQPISSV